MVADTEAGHNQEAKKESISLFGQGKAFGTPKPERLLERIIHLATNEGDLVLDSFAGSGTTGAVAKMLGRNYIGIEEDKKYIKEVEESIKPKNGHC